MQLPPLACLLSVRGRSCAPLHPLEATVFEVVAEDAREEPAVPHYCDDLLGPCGDPLLEHVNAFEQVVLGRRRPPDLGELVNALD